MLSVWRATMVAILVFACAMAGLLLQFALPTAMVVDGRAAVGSVVGVVALLIALVLGLLIWTSYGVFAAQQAEAQTLDLTTLQLDFLLEQYGPEAAPGRIGLRDAVRGSHDRFFGGNGQIAGIGFERARLNLFSIENFFASLQPSDEHRKQLLASAKPLATSIVQTQMLMSRQLDNPVPMLLIVMVQIWSAMLFFGFGVMGNPGIFSIVADAAGAFAISSAVFLIIEFSEPYKGLFRISPKGIEKVIAELDANAPIAKM